MIERLPNWLLPNMKPSFNDLESATAIEMVNKLYGKNQELIDDYIKFIDDIKNEVNAFKTSTNQDMECFEKRITKICEDYIETIDKKIKCQDKQIEQAVLYMKDNLVNTIKNLNENGELNGMIVESLSNIEHELTVKQKEYEQSLNTKQTSYQNKIDSQVRSLASGNPLVASSVEGMTDTSKVYVNTTDGNWYYYNGTEWVIGGVYQSSGIGENSISIDKLFHNLKNSFSPVVNNISYKDNITMGKYVSSKGNKITNESTILAEIDVIEHENYIINAGYNTGMFGLENPLYLILDENNNILESEIISEATNTILTRNIVIPANAKKLLINSINWKNSTINSNFGLTILKVENYIQSNKIKYSQLDEKLKEIIKEKYDNFSRENLEVLKSPGLMGGGMGIGNTAGYTIYKLNVTPGEKFIFDIYNFYNQTSIYLGSKDVVYQVTSSDSIVYELNGQMKQIKGEKQDSYNTIEVEIPEGCEVIYINNQDNKDFTIKKLSGYEINISSFENCEINPLSNKILCFNGDSITQATQNGDGITTPILPYNNRGWVSRIKENNPSSEVYGYGVGGTTIAKRSERTDSIIERTVEIYNSHPNLDYLIIEGGINDMFVGVPLGEISEGYNEEYNENTFCGALESLFRYITLNFKGKKYGFINIFKVPSCYSQKDYVPKIKEICNKWQIPLLNLYEESNLNYYLDDIKEEYSQITNEAPNGDGLHPNNKGYDLLQRKIETWIKSL